MTAESIFFNIKNMRRKDREITDFNTVKEIIEKCKIVHLGFSKDNTPYVVPLNFGFDPQNNLVYFHCASKGMKLDFLNSNPTVCLQFCTGYSLTVPENPDKGCGYGFNYESVTAWGNGSVVYDTAEKIRALKLIMIQQTGKDFEFTDIEAQTVTIVRIEIESFFGKKRSAF